MANNLFPLTLLLLFLLANVQPMLGMSFETSDDIDFDRMPTEDQRILNDAVVLPGASVICETKPALVHNLEQLAFYIKADCQGSSNTNKSQVGCSCNPPTCAIDCTPWAGCCRNSTGSLLGQLQDYNAFYASHFKELFGGQQPKRV